MISPVLDITIKNDSGKNGIIKQSELKHSIEIETTPEKIWDFRRPGQKLYGMHPEDHVSFKWTKGKPLELGSSFYAQ